MEQHVLKPISSMSSFEDQGRIITVFTKSIEKQIVHHPLYGKITVFLPNQDYMMTRLN